MRGGKKRILHHREGGQARGARRYTKRTDSRQVPLLLNEELEVTLRTWLVRRWFPGIHTRRAHKTRGLHRPCVCRKAQHVLKSISKPQTQVGWRRSEVTRKTAPGRRTPSS